MDFPGAPGRPKGARNRSRRHSARRFGPDDLRCLSHARGVGDKCRKGNPGVAQTGDGQGLTAMFKVSDVGLKIPLSGMLISARRTGRARRPPFHVKIVQLERYHPSATWTSWIRFSGGQGLRRKITCRPSYSPAASAMPLMTRTGTRGESARNWHTNTEPLAPGKT